MPYSAEVVQRARARLRDARREKEETYARHRDEAYQKYPRLQEIDRALRETMAQTVAACLSRGGDPAAAVEEIRKKNLALQREREWILEASDLGADYLDDSPVCTLCGGEGYVGQTMCSCLQELCRQEQRRELSSFLPLGAERFEDFRLDLYSDAPDEVYGVSPRENMTRVFRTVRAWAQSFTPSSPPLLFTGGTGLGKTFLSACVARKVSDLGFSVVYETASRVVADFEAEKFGHEPELARTRKYLECDLLILDDLGTEMTTQFAVSAFYQLVNTRMMASRPCVISTNLSLEQIRARYGVQLYSRLAGTYEGLLFFGQDIRLMQK